MIEHDASLIHNDEYFGGDPAQVNITLAKQLLGRGQSNGTLGVMELGAARKARLANSIAINSNTTFNSTQQTVAFGEASILILVFGSKNNETVTVDTACSFLVDEKIPDEWERATSAISTTEIEATAAKIVAASV
ncbi:Aromatic peroxygenase [Phytophthora citrophthora]|uniref:Aromatic peroxygenase n=1 Tax=Phytophthora citrophthora TaxID=4793 RepID=A0AAD9LMM4_9STRA|nr:Aromatic peroxygenase [Phytophthora citrophthora]